MQHYAKSRRAFYSCALCPCALLCIIAIAHTACRQNDRDNQKRRDVADEQAAERRIPEPLPQSSEVQLEDETKTIYPRQVSEDQDRPPPARLPAAGKPSYAGQTVTFLVQEEGQVPIAFIEAAEEFQATTGAELRIVKRPFADVYLEFTSDAMSAKPRFDGVLAGAWWLGDLIDRGLIRDYDDYYGDPRFPSWDIDDVLDAPRALLSYDGKKYMVPLDHDGQILYYRRDIFADKAHQAAFAKQYGYALAVPQTWAEFRDIAAYFHGKDLNGDGETDYGVSMHLRAGAQGMFHFMSFSAPFVIGPENREHYWFAPKSMDPLIDSPGHLRALERFVELVQYGPRDMLEWDLGRSWDLFLEGRAAMAFTWGDLAVLAQQKGSKVKGKTGSAMLPGTMSYYSIDKQRWIDTTSPNRVGNTTGGSWGGVISTKSKYPEATYYLLSILATREKGIFYATRGSDGIDPGRTSQLLRPHGTADIAQFLKLGWAEEDVRDFHLAVASSYAANEQFPYLRIPGTFSYWQILDAKLFLAASKQLSPAEALKSAKIDYQIVIDEHGRPELARIYARSQAGRQ